jgi:glycosyltransferase involved in cell wall biosynthesis
MISVIMPYYNRSFALLRALSLFDVHYSGMDIEVIIVDDGSIDPPAVERYGFPAKIITLPRKDHPLSPCVPINVGVAYSKGDVLVITNPEMIHHKPVFQGMLATLERIGPSGVVMAAAFCREQDKWHCHSELCSYETPMPPGAGLHFCQMLYRTMWDRAGGFDRDYRDGAAYDDNDWAWRLHMAGAEFRIRDDLVVEHPKSGARLKWPAAGLIRNRELFEAKWPG